MWRLSFHYALGMSRPRPPQEKENSKKLFLSANYHQLTSRLCLVILDAFIIRILPNLINIKKSRCQKVEQTIRHVILLE